MCVQVLFRKFDAVFSRVYEGAEGWDEISPGQEILLFSTDDADGADMCWRMYFSLTGLIFRNKRWFVLLFLDVCPPKVIDPKIQNLSPNFHRFTVH